MLQLVALDFRNALLAPDHKRFLRTKFEPLASSIYWINKKKAIHVRRFTTNPSCLDIARESPHFHFQCWSSSKLHVQYQMTWFKLTNKCNPLPIEPGKGKPVSMDTLSEPSCRTPLQYRDIHCTLYNVQTVERLVANGLFWVNIAPGIRSFDPLKSGPHLKLSLTYPLEFVEEASRFSHSTSSHFATFDRPALDSVRFRF